MDETASPKPPRTRGRPRKVAADQTARRALIRSGLIYLTEKGYSSAGIDDILRHAGVPKGSFYYYFASKADFGRALIEAYHSYFAAKLESWFCREDISPLDRLRGFIGDAAAGMARHQFRRGCLAGNLGQEMPVLPEEFRQQLVDILTNWQDRTAQCLKAAQDCGQIHAGHNIDDLAAFFWIGWEGAVLRAKLEQSPAPLHRFAAGFFQLAAITGKYAYDPRPFD